MNSAAGSAGLVPSTGIERAALREEIVRRRAALESRMDEVGIEALIVASEANDFYLTGYETTFFGNKSKPLAVVLVRGEVPIVVCHVGEEPSVRLDAIDVGVETYLGPDRTVVDGHVQLEYQRAAATGVLDVLERLGVGSIGLEMSWHFMPGFTPLAFDLIRDGGRRVHDASGVLWDVRRVKSPWEVAQMRIAADVAAVTHSLFAERAKVGMSERELGRLLRHTAYEAGAEKIGYSGIIAGIDRAPLGGPSDRVWERGQMLFVDICLQLNGGYFADFDRIYASGSPTSAQRLAYEDAVSGLDRAYAVVRAGATVAEVAEAILGDGETIYSRVGHGLGLEMPEPPSLAAGDETRLSSGEVVCLEPNLERAGVGSLVVEEEVLVRDGGFELLSPSFPRELVVIG